MVADEAVWGHWMSKGNTIIFARGAKVYSKVYSKDLNSKDLNSDQEKLLIDGNKHFRRTVLQQPQISPDGNYVAITLRGRSRETGIFDLKTQTWRRTGDGCAINFIPDGNKIYPPSPRTPSWPPNGPVDREPGDASLH